MESTLAMLVLVLLLIGVETLWDSGNINALDVNGLCCVAGAAVKNTAGFTGGQDAYTYATVRQADIDGLARPLLDTLTQDATFGGRSELRPQEWLVTIPDCLPAISADHPVGSRAKQVTVMVSLTCRDEVYDQQTARRVAESAFMQEMNTMLGAKYVLGGQVTTTLLGVRMTDAKRGTLALSIVAGGVWVYHWSPARLKALARSIAGAGKQGSTQTLAPGGRSRGRQHPVVRSRAYHEEKDKMTKPMKIDAMPKGMALGATAEVIAAWLEEAGVPVRWRALAANTEVYPERNAWYLEEIVHLAGAIPMIGIGVADAYAAVIVGYRGGSYVLEAAGASLDEAIEALYQRVYDCLYGRKANSPALCSLESEPRVSENTPEPLSPGTT